MGLIRASGYQPDLLGIHDEDAVLIKQDSSGLPVGFVAVMHVLTVEAGFVVIGGDPLFDGLPGWFEGVDVEREIGRLRDADEALHRC